MYPCPDCKEHLKTIMKNNPFRNENRVELALYVCDLHNIVNKSLNKPQFDCKKSLEYWGGDCGCMQAKFDSLDKNKTSTYKTPKIKKSFFG